MRAARHPGPGEILASAVKLQTRNGLWPHFGFTLVLVTQTPPEGPGLAGCPRHHKEQALKGRKWTVVAAGEFGWWGKWAADPSSPWEARELPLQLPVAMILTEAFVGRAPWTAFMNSKQRPKPLELCLVFCWVPPWKQKTKAKSSVLGKLELGKKKQKKKAKVPPRWWQEVKGRLCCRTASRYLPATCWKQLQMIRERRHLRVPSQVLDKTRTFLLLF